MRLILIYAIVFVNGAALMAFEILGSRALAPGFGSSIFVWGALIGVFMAGMSLGYFGGGWLADRGTSDKIFSLLIGIPAVLMLTFPYYGFPIVEMVADADLGPRGGPFIACLFLFLIPSIFMGAVSPYAFVLAIHDLKTAGRRVGSLYAVSTVGSIVGTLGTAFYLILIFGTKSSLQLIGMIQLIVAVVALSLEQKVGVDSTDSK